MAVSITNKGGNASDSNDTTALVTLYSRHRDKTKLETPVAEMFARIREARRRAGVSQEEFAAQLGVSRGAVAQWEMEEGTSPSIKNLEQVAKISGLCFEWLGTGRGPKKFGEPQIQEEEASYTVKLSKQVQALLDYAIKMDKSDPDKLRSLLNVLGIR